MTVSTMNENNDESDERILTWDKASAQQKQAFSSKEEFDEYALFVRMRQRRRESVSHCESWIVLTYLKLYYLTFCK